ncbi:MAG: four helix bundle protein [Gemmataceae bacterium]|nr:four helix bundle protein [Gemmataceae bacterium]
MLRKGDELLERLLNFAARVGKVVDAFPDKRMGRHVAGQLVRCGTSPAPNYAEACGAESRKDFVHKLSIALKELQESRCWLLLIVKAELLLEERLVELIDESEQLVKIIAKSIVTTKTNQARPRAPEPIPHFAFSILHCLLCTLFVSAPPEGTLSCQSR